MVDVSTSSRLFVMRDRVWVEAHPADFCHRVRIVRRVHGVCQEELGLALWCIDLYGVERSWADENAVVSLLDDDERVQEQS